jgi:hypothetical protein
MSSTIGRARPRATKRTLVGAAIATAALAASLLTAPAAFAAAEPTSTTPSLTGLSTWHEWVNPADYDYETTTLGSTPALRMSNGLTTTGPFGNITQVSSPAGSLVGESTTGAPFRVFTAEYTIAAEAYTAQPGLAIEVSADKSGNRSGGSIVFRHDADNQLTLSTYWANAGGAVWNNDTETVPFTAPVKIRHVVEYNSGAPDSVKVYVNGVLAVSGQGYEAYHDAASGTKQTIDSLMFRTSRLTPVPGGAWTADYPTEQERQDVRGNGFYFSGIEYGASNVALAPSTTLAVQAGILGTPIVGGSLHAYADTNVISGAAYSYQWYRGSLAISGAKSADYSVAANDAGKQLSVKITATKAGYASGSDTSDKTLAVASATQTFATPVTITGPAELGATLVSGGEASLPSTYTRQWFRDGTIIKGATGVSYKTSASDVGTHITVTVTASRPGYVALVDTSLPTAEIAPGDLVAGTVTLAGTAKVGSVLTAKSTGWTAGTSLKYAFFADGELVQLSPSAKLKLTFEEKGTTITVIAIGAKFGYEKTESAESSARGPVA